jgi:hypothetical protein
VSEVRTALEGLLEVLVCIVGHIAVVPGGLKHEVNEVLHLPVAAASVLGQIEAPRTVFREFVVESVVPTSELAMEAFQVPIRKIDARPEGGSGREPSHTWVDFDAGAAQLFVPPGALRNCAFHDSSDGRDGQRRGGADDGDERLRIHSGAVSWRR